MRPEIRRRSVDLPQPDGPMSDTNEPEGISSDTLSSAVMRSPVGLMKCLETPEMEMLPTITMR